MRRSKCKAIEPVLYDKKQKLWVAVEVLTGRVVLGPMPKRDLMSYNNVLANHYWAIDLETESKVKFKNKGIPKEQMDAFKCGRCV